jgi:hypothetical protein
VNSPKKKPVFLRVFHPVKLAKFGINERKGIILFEFSWLISVIFFQLTAVFPLLGGISAKKILRFF